MFQSALNMLLYTIGSSFMTSAKKLENSDPLPFSTTIQFWSEDFFPCTFLIGLNTFSYSEDDVSGFSSKTLTVRSMCKVIAGKVKRRYPRRLSCKAIVPPVSIIGLKVNYKRSFSM